MFNTECYVKNVNKVENDFFFKTDNCFWFTGEWFLCVLNIKPPGSKCCPFISSKVLQNRGLGCTFPVQVFLLSLGECQTMKVLFACMVHVAWNARKTEKQNPSPRHTLLPWMIMFLCFILNIFLIFYYVFFTYFSFVLFSSSSGPPTSFCLAEYCLNLKKILLRL